MEIFSPDTNDLQQNDIVNGRRGFFWLFLTKNFYRYSTESSVNHWYTNLLIFWSGTNWYTKLTKVNKRLTNTWNWAAFCGSFFISLSYFVYHSFSCLRILLLICWKMNFRSLQHRTPVVRQSSNMIHLIHYDISWYMVTYNWVQYLLSDLKITIFASWVMQKSYHLFLRISSGM